MTIGVDSVLYDIPRCEDGPRSRCGPEVLGGGCQIFANVEIVDNGINCQQVFS